MKDFDECEQWPEMPASYTKYKDSFGKEDKCSKNVEGTSPKMYIQQSKMFCSSNIKALGTVWSPDRTELVIGNRPLKHRDAWKY